MTMPAVQNPITSPVRSASLDRRSGRTDPHAAAMKSFAGGVQGCAFQLTDLSKLFVDTSRTTALGVAGEYAAAFEDLSGNGNHATQSTTSRQTYWYNGMKFVAADDSYVTPAFTMAGRYATLILRVAPQPNASNSIICELSANSGTNPNSLVVYAPNTSTNQYSVEMRGTSGTVSRQMPGNVAPLESVIIVDLDLAATTVITQLGIEITPINGTTTTGGPAAVGTAWGTYQFHIGRRAESSLPLKATVKAVGLIGKQMGAAEKTIWRDWANLDLAPAQHGAITDKLVVVKRGNDLYFRTKSTSTKDLVRKLSMLNGVSTVPEMVNPMGARLVLNTEIDVKTGFDNATGSDIIGPEGDDSCPIQYGSATGGTASFMGANHGNDRCRRVPATAHGKTIEDVGSVWTDSGARRWVLMRIVDVNTLEFQSENQSVYPAWSFHTTLSGTTLVHASGPALHTGDITHTAATVFQLYPATNKHVRAALLDGVKEIFNNSPNAIHVGNICNVHHDYTIMNPADIVRFAKARVGSSVAPDYYDSSIDGDVDVSIQYVYAPWHGAMIDQTINSLRNLTLVYAGFTQAVALTKSGTDTIWAYAPRLNSFTMGANTYNLSAQRQFTSWPDTVLLDNTKWTQPLNPPASLTHLIKNAAGVKQHSLTQGYITDFGDAIPAVRAANITEAGHIAASTGKHYMEGINGTGSTFPGGVWAANRPFRIKAYRCYANHVENFPHGPEFSIIPDGNDFVVLMSFDVTLSNQLIVLPPKMDGYTASVIQNETTSANVTLHSAASSGGLTVTVTGSGDRRLGVRLTPATP